MTCLKMNDTITLVATQPDEYGTEEVESEAEVRAAVDLSTGYSHGANQDAVESDAVAFLSPEDEFVSDNFYRLEEMLVSIPLFGTPERRTWYKVVSVNVARDTQLCNEIDHLELLLKKTAPLPESSS